MKTDLQKYCFGESAVTLFLVVCLLHILGTAKVVDTILAIISASSQTSLNEWSLSLLIRSSFRMTMLTF